MFSTQLKQFGEASCFVTAPLTSVGFHKLMWHNQTVN